MALGGHDDQHTTPYGTGSRGVKVALPGGHSVVRNPYEVWPRLLVASMDYEIDET